MAFASYSDPGTILVARREMKYRVRPEELPALRQWLLQYCVPDENSRGAEWYGIRSLYLDNSDFRLFHDAEQKITYRLKLRARAYGNVDGDVKLEVKRRVGPLVVKTSATARKAQWAEAAPAGLAGLSRLQKPSMAEFLQFTESLRATPRMLVYYERQAFSSVVDDYVRVTFDRNICCQPVETWDLAGDPRAWVQLDGPGGFGERESTYVLEVKFVDSPPEWLRDFVLTFGLERRGGSKYVRSMQRAAFYREPAWDWRAGMWAGEAA
jgi:hypothetical protein